MIEFSQLNPPMAFVDFLRTVNFIGGILAVLCLVFWLGLPRWDDWNIPTRLGWMALLLWGVTASYGSFEAQYMDTYLRVPMATVSILWSLLSALWPRDKVEPRSRKPRHGT